MLFWALPSGEEVAFLILFVMWRSHLYSHSSFLHVSSALCIPFTLPSQVAWEKWLAQGSIEEEQIKTMKVADLSPTRESATAPC